MNRRQRILFTSVVSFLVPIQILIISALTARGVGDTLSILMILLTPLPLAAGFYFLSFKIWDKKKQEVQEDQEPENSFTNKQRFLYALVTACTLPAIMVGLVASLPLGELWDDNVFFIIFLSLSSLIVAVLVYFLSFKIWKREDQEPENSLTKKQRILYALVTACAVPAVIVGLVASMMASIPLGVLGYVDDKYFLIIFLSSLIEGVLVYFLSFKIWKREDQETGVLMNKKQRILYALVTVCSVPAVVGVILAIEPLGVSNIITAVFLSSPIVAGLVYFLSFKIWKREDRGAEERKLSNLKKI